MQSPIVLLGAARSGTKMLRSLISAGGEIPAVPYDVNYIWRYRNESSPNDALDPLSATPEVIRFIRKSLKRAAGVQEESTPFVEKTVSNILRIPFVLRVLPEARFVALIRDGRDVIESAHRCWQAPPDIKYVFDKLKTFPITSCPRYAFGYGVAQIKRALGHKKPPIWGPRYQGVERDVLTKPLVEVCAQQWTQCMESYEQDRSLIPQQQLLEIRYETLVRNPLDEVDRLVEFLGIHDPTPLYGYAQREIQQANVGKHTSLSPDEQSAIENIAGSVLHRWGYFDSTNSDLNRATAAA